MTSRDVSLSDSESCPNDLFILPDGSTAVQDADEEIMELYMQLNNVPARILNKVASELGYMDGSNALLELDFEINPTPITTQPTISLNPVQVDQTGLGKKKPSSRRNNESKNQTVKKGLIYNLKIYQDMQMLKASKGDTVCSGEAAKNILSRHHFPSPTLPSLLNRDKLSNTRILELGSGTGLLACLLAPLCKEYIASDRLENLKLLQRNLQENGLISPHSSPKQRKRELSNHDNLPTGSNSKGKLKENNQGSGKGIVTVEEIDWEVISRNRQRRQHKIDDEKKEDLDLILAVDCIFNESLVIPLIDTFCEYATRGITVVWVVVELRSSDVLTLFLEKWLTASDPPWKIFRIPPESLGDWDGEMGKWVGWVGWKV